MSRLASSTRRLALLALCITPLAASAAEPLGHFRVHSRLDPRLVAYITRNVEAYYRNLTPRFFAKGFDRPLAIYYSGTAAETRSLLESFGEPGDAGYGRYYGRIRTPEGAQPAVFTHRRMDDGSPAGWARCSTRSPITSRRSTLATRRPGSTRGLRAFWASARARSRGDAPSAARIPGASGRCET